MKTAQDLKAQFRRLEAAGNDDFELIMLGGPEAYATHELSQLLRQLKVRKIRCRNQQKQLFRLAATLPAFLTLSLLFIAIDRLPMVYFCLGISAAIAVLFIWRTRQLRIFLREVSQRDPRLYSIISRELRRRRSGVV